jgi:membrane protein YdbS with pleckstrin-like domain
MLRAVAILALVVTATTSQAPSPTPAKAGQEPQHTARDEHRERGDNQEATKNSPTTSASQADSIKTNEGSAKAPPEIRQQPAGDWWIVILTAVIALMTVAQFGAMVWQGKHMRDQVTVMRQQVEAVKMTNASDDRIAPEAENHQEDQRKSAAAQPSSRMKLLLLLDSPVGRVVNLSVIIYGITNTIVTTFPKSPLIALGLIAAYITMLTLLVTMWMINFAFDATAREIDSVFDIISRLIDALRRG